MARTALPIITPLGSYPALPLTALSANFVFTAADATAAPNGNSFVSTGRELLLVQNTDSGAHTITFTSVADGLNRTGDITTYSIGAGLFSVFGPFNVPGWRQTTGVVFVNANDATVKIAVISLPSIA